MNNLILPPALAAKIRPYATVPTTDLLTELHHRGVVQELTVQGPLPNDLPPETVTVIRQQSFAQMLQQLAQALAQFAFAGSGHQPPDTREWLVLKLIVVRHPLIPASAPVVEAAPVPEDGA